MAYLSQMNKFLPSFFPIHDHFSNEPICLTPEQAVSAAQILGAKMLIPIHYGAFHNPPFYNESPDVIQRLKPAAASKSVELYVLRNAGSVVINDLVQDSPSSK